jgi:glycosyltransferase involved in cell wall biosynthesis
LKVTLIVPTLNEIEGMKEIMPRIKPEWYDRLIIVDGGSTDGTLEYARDHGYLVVSQTRRGMRYAYLEALAHADGDVVVTFSPDGNCVPERLPELIGKMREGYDMAIVSRYAGEARSDDDSALTSLANRVFTAAVNVLFRARYTDAMVIFRAYKRDLIHALDLDKDSSYFPAESIFRTIMSWEMLLSIRCAKRKLKVAEIPGDEPCRIGGRRPLHVMWGLAYILQLFQEAFVWR